MTHSMAGVTVSTRKWYAGGDLLVSTEPSASSLTAIKTIKFAEFVGLVTDPSKPLEFHAVASITHISAADLKKASEPTAGTRCPVKVILDNLLVSAGVFLDFPDRCILGRDGTSIVVFGENSLVKRASLISISDRSSATAIVPAVSAAASAKQ